MPRYRASDLLPAHRQKAAIDRRLECRLDGNIVNVDLPKQGRTGAIADALKEAVRNKLSGRNPSP